MGRQVTIEAGLVDERGVPEIEARYLQSWGRSWIAGSTERDRRTVAQWVLRKGAVKLEKRTLSISVWKNQLARRKPPSAGHAKVNCSGVGVEGKNKDGMYTAKTRTEQRYCGLSP